jgi:hypothetical protein
MALKHIIGTDTVYVDISEVLVCGHLAGDSQKVSSINASLKAFIGEDGGVYLELTNRKILN